MRKDFIMTEEEKQLRKERLEQIRTVSSKRSSSTEDTPSHSNVLSETLDQIDHVSDLILIRVQTSNEDWFLVNDEYR